MNAFVASKYRVLRVVLCVLAGATHSGAAQGPPAAPLASHRPEPLAATTYTDQGLAPDPVLKTPEMQAT